MFVESKFPFHSSSLVSVGVDSSGGLLDMVPFEVPDGVSISGYPFPVPPPPPIGCTMPNLPPNYASNKLS